MAIQKTGVRRSGKALRIELAPTKIVAKHEEEIGEILSILDHQEALVTDESLLSDFEPDDKVIIAIKKLSGKSFGTYARIVDVAEAIRKSKKSKSLSKRRKTDEG